MVSERSAYGYRRAPVWRVIVSTLAVIVFCLSAPLALFGGWTRVVLANPDSYVQLARSLATDQAVQSAVANALVTEISRQGLTADETAIGAAPFEASLPASPTAAPVVATATATVTATVTPVPTAPPATRAAVSAIRIAGSPTAAAIAPAAGATATSSAVRATVTLPPTSDSAPAALATPLAVAIASPRAATPAPPSAAPDQTVLARAAERVVSSPEFVSFWETANRAAHQYLFARRVAERAGLTVDLTPLIAEMRDQLVASNLPRQAVDQLLAAQPSVEVLDPATVDRVQRVVDRLDWKVGAVIALAVVSLLLALISAPSRLLVLRRLGFGVMVTTIVLLLALLLGQMIAVARLSDPLMTPVVQAVLDLVVSRVVLLELVLALVGLVVGLGASFLYRTMHRA